MKYKVARRLGSGGFGNVYEVQASDGNIYAMKLLKDLSPANKQRFEREIKILAQLNHPNIVKIVEWNLGGDPVVYHGVFARRVSQRPHAR
jgi:serine/threonine-protein kinase